MIFNINDIKNVLTKLDGKVDDTVTTSSSSASRFSRYGKLVVANFYGLSVNAPVCPSGYRPSISVSFPVVIVLNSKAYQGYVTVATSGAMTVRYYDYSGAPATPTTGSVIYGCGSWFTS